MTSTKPRIQRQAHLEWVPLPMMKVSPRAQRDFNQGWADKLAANMDLEQIGAFTVNYRDEIWYVIDGQHRKAALEGIGYGDQQVQCWAYRGLTEEEEAEMFLKLHDALTVGAFAKFKVAVVAGRPEETEIDRIVRSCGLHITQGGGHGAVSAVGTLRRIFQMGGTRLLTRTMCVIRDAYGDPGLEAVVMSGISQLLQRYPDLTDDRTVSALSRASARLGGLMNRAEVLRNQTHAPRGQCVAAAAVELINAYRGGGKRLANWWRSEPAQEVA